MAVLPTPDDRIQSGKQLAGFASELTDDEIKQVIGVVNDIRLRYSTKAFTLANLEALRDEILHRMANIGVLVSVDVATCLNGEPPTVEIVGKVGDAGFQKEFDHEKKRYEVNKAIERGEDYLGQTGDADGGKAKKRYRAQ